MSSDVLIGDARAQSARARESASAAGAIERRALGAGARRGEAIGGAGVGDAICERNGAMGLRKRGHEVSFAVDCVRALPAFDVLFEHMRVDGPPTPIVLFFSIENYLLLPFPFRFRLYFFTGQIHNRAGERRLRWSTGRGGRRGAPCGGPGLGFNGPSGVYK